MEKQLYPQGIPVVEFTHLHGSEKLPKHVFDICKSVRYVGLGFLSEDTLASVTHAEKAGGQVLLRPNPKGVLPHLGFVLESDGYLFEILRRGADYTEMLGMKFNDEPTSRL